jgi:hypothetical protein
VTDYATPEGPPATARFLTVFDRVERIYLLILRVSILAIATALLVYAAWLAVSGLYRASLSPSSIVEANASVTANEIVETDKVATPDVIASRTGASPDQRKFYGSFVPKYYALFRKNFEPYRHPEDKTLSRDEFDDAYVRSTDRLAAITDGRVSFDADKADLESLIATMSTASSDSALKLALKRYRSAKKVAVEHKVERTRSETRSGWNSLSTSCANWYTDPIGCSETRSVQVPYTATETRMEYPTGIKSPGQVFHDMQDRYFSLLERRREENRAEADRQRQAIRERNADGAAALASSWQVVGGFIAIMFFFLLIAIERHQRRLGAEMNLLREPRAADPQPAT